MAFQLFALKKQLVPPYNVLPCGVEIPSGVQNPRMSYMVGVLEAYVYHQARWHINRDVKTGNIFIDSNAVTKLADFRVFRHLCLILGICNTPEILLLELLDGASQNDGC